MADPLLVFTIPGPPVPKGRPRRGRGNMYTPEKTRAYEKHIAWFATGAVSAHRRAKKQWFLRDDFDVRMWICWQNFVKRGDGDNVLKSILDGCEKILWHNDKQVWSTNHYPLFEGAPRVILAVYSASESPEPPQDTYQ